MKEELQKISDFFNLGEILNIEKAAGNANRNSYITTHQGKYFIKIIEERSEFNEVFSEIPYIERLKSKIKIVPYIKNHKGESLFHEGKTIALVQPFVKNISFKKSDSMVLQLVGEQARLHGVDSSNLPNRRHWIDLGYIDRALSEIEKNNWMTDTNLLRRHPSVSQDWSGCATGIVHGDLHLGNALFGKDQKLLAIVDWEEVGSGYYLLDFAMTVGSFCFGDELLDRELLSRMIKTYESIRPFSNVEKQLLDLAIQRASITGFVWSCLRNHIRGEKRVWDAKKCKCFKYFK